jgi:hypothetical protein
MEYIEGESMRTWQARRGRHWRAIVAAYLQAARGLAAIHERGIVHQDIKPDNMRVDAHGVVRILDFGFAYLAESSLLYARSLSRSGRAAPMDIPWTLYSGGTPGYMAPEQYLCGNPLDARVDQFAFCAALWEAVFGVLPFPEEAIVASVLGEPRRRLGPPRAGTRPGPRWLRAILLRGLAAEPRRRFPTMMSLVSALERKLERRWRVTGSTAAGAGLGGAFAGALVGLILAGPSIPLCSAPGFGLIDGWNVERRAELGQAFRSAGDEAARAWSAAEEAFASNLRRVQTARLTLCQQASRQGDTAVLSTRARCLVLQRRQFSAVLRSMAVYAENAGDPGVAWSDLRLGWEQYLADIPDCTDESSMMYHGYELPEVESVALEAAFSAAIADLLAQRPSARERFADLAVETGRLGEDWLRARALYRMGLAEDGLGLELAAEAHLIEAAQLAEVSADELLVADALSRWILVRGERGATFDAVSVPASIVRGKLGRLRLATSPRATNLDIALVRAALNDADPARAEALLGADAFRSDAGPPSPESMRVDMLRARLEERRGRPGDALRRVESALRRQLDTLGPHGSWQIEAWGALGRLRLADRRELRGAALSALERSVADARGQTGDRGIPVGRSRYMLARAYYQLCDCQERYGGCTASGDHVEEYERECRRCRVDCYTPALREASAADTIFQAGERSASGVEWQIASALLLGLIRAEMGDLERAAADLSRGLALSRSAPGGADVAEERLLLQMGLAEISFRRGARRTATLLLPELRATLQAPSAPPWALVSLAEIEHWLRYHQWAAEHARRALNSSPPAGELAERARAVVRRRKAGTVNKVHIFSGYLDHDDDKWHM